MRLYYFTTAEHGLMAIRDRRLKVSEINKLNDPFEFLSPNLSNKEIRGKLKQLKKHLSSKIGIICFCGNWQHPLMWAHYTKSHSGICLGFDVSDPRLHKIIYEETRQAYPVDDFREVGTPEKARDIFEKISGKKFTCWKYEDEYRIIRKLTLPDPVNQLHFIDFSESLVLKEVIVGCEAKISRNRIEQVLGELKTQVNTFRSRPAFRDFTVVEDKRKWE